MSCHIKRDVTHSTNTPNNRPLGQKTWILQYMGVDMSYLFNVDREETVRTRSWAMYVSFRDRHDTIHPRPLERERPRSLLNHDKVLPNFPFMVKFRQESNNYYMGHQQIRFMTELFHFKNYNMKRRDNIRSKTFQCRYIPSLLSQRAPKRGRHDCFDPAWHPVLILKLVHFRDVLEIV